MRFTMNDYIRQGEYVKRRCLELERPLARGIAGVVGRLCEAAHRRARKATPTRRVGLQWGQVLMVEQAGDIVCLK